MDRRAHIEKVKGGYIVSYYGENEIFTHREVYTDILLALVRVAELFEPLAAISEVDLAQAVEEAVEVQDG